MTDRERSQDHVATHVDFERYALALIEAEVQSARRTFLVGNELPAAFSFADAFAPDGVLDVEGPTIVEIKLRLTEAILPWLRRTAASMSAGTNVLLVVREREDSIAKARRRLRLDTFGEKLHIIGRGQLDSLAKRFPAAALPYTGGNLRHAFRALEEATTDTGQREAQFAALRAAYRDDRLALFTGAGVSRSAGLPDWNELVKRVSSAVFDKYASSPLAPDERIEIQRLFDGEVPTSPLIMPAIARQPQERLF